MNDSTNTYTVVEPNSGEVIEEGVDAVKAAELILTHDGRQHKLVRVDGGWAIYDCHPVAGFHEFERTKFWSTERLPDAIEALAAQVIATRIPGLPEAVLDNVYAAQMEEAGL